MRKTGCAGRYAHAEQIRLLQEEGHVGVLTVLREAHFVVGVLGDAALTRPGRTISLGEGIDKHAFINVHLVFVIPVYLVSFYLK